MIQFFILKLHFGGLYFTSPPNLNCALHKKERCTKFGTWCTKLYKMSTKLWSSFLCWNCISEAACYQPPQIWITDSTRGNGVQNFGLDVQNCTKLVQNYDILFVLEIRFKGAGDMYLFWQLFPYRIILPTCQSFKAPSSISEGDRHKRLRTFWYEVQFWTTFIRSFFWCDAYFWQSWALN